MNERQDPMALFWKDVVNFCHPPFKDERTLGSDIFILLCLCAYIKHTYFCRPSKHKCSCSKMPWCNPSSVQKLCYIECQCDWDNQLSSSSVSLCWQHRRLWIKALPCWASLDRQNTLESISVRHYRYISRGTGS